MLNIDDQLFYMVETSLRYLDDPLQKTSTKKAKTIKNKGNNKRGKSSTQEVVKNEY